MRGKGKRRARPGVSPAPGSPQPQRPARIRPPGAPDGTWRGRRLSPRVRVARIDRAVPSDVAGGPGSFSERMLRALGTGRDGTVLAIAAVLSCRAGIFPLRQEANHWWPYARFGYPCGEKKKKRKQARTALQVERWAVSRSGERVCCVVGFSFAAGGVRYAQPLFGSFRVISTRSETRRR